MDIITAIREKLTKAYAPSELAVRDDSVQHYGHDGATPGQVSHVGIVIVSAAFAGKSRVDRSRMVYTTIADEVKQIHAVTELKTQTPEEFAASGGQLRR